MHFNICVCELIHKFYQIITAYIKSEKENIIFMKHKRIPDETIRRLPVYLRVFMLLREDDEERMSSTGLGEFVGIHPWQIRKNFSYFGDFGVRGVGYEIKSWFMKLRELLLTLQDILLECLIIHLLDREKLLIMS